MGTPYLQRRGNVWTFRRVLPKHLRSLFGRGEIKASLHTERRAVAEARCRDLACAFDCLIAAIEMKTLSRSQIDALVQAYFQREWAEANEGVGFPDDPYDPDRARLAKQKAGRLYARLSTREVDESTKSVAEGLLAEGGHTVGDLSPEDFDHLCYGLLRARTEKWRIVSAIADGRLDLAKPNDPLFQNVPHPVFGSGGCDPASKTIADAVKEHLERGKRRMAGKTLEDKKRALDWFVEFVGPNHTLQNVTKDHIRNFRDALEKLPARFTIRPEFKGKTLQQLAQVPGAERIKPATALKLFTHVRVFFKEAEAEGLINEAPIGSINVSVKKALEQPRIPFQDEDLQRLFSSPVWTGHAPNRLHEPGSVLTRDAKYWMPLIALFSGLRLAEIAQLRLGDVLRTKKGTWYFDVNAGQGEKTLKTGTSVRKVPLHPVLENLGFLAHVEENRTRGHERVFPDVKPYLRTNGDQDFGHAFSKWFARYLDHIGLTDRRLTFHSFRHSFADALRRGNVDDARVKALIGHADTSTTAGYGYGFDPDMLAQDIARVSYDVDWAHLQAE